jgi:hypothetical protein
MAEQADRNVGEDGRMRINLVVLRNGQLLFEYEMKAHEEGDALVAEAKLALDVFQHLNPTVSLFNPEVSISFQKGE